MTTPRYVTSIPYPIHPALPWVYGYPPGYSSRVSRFGYQGYNAHPSTFIQPVYPYIQRPQKFFYHPDTFDSFDPRDYVKPLPNKPLSETLPVRIPPEEPVEKRFSESVATQHLPEKQPNVYFYSPGKHLSYSDLDELIASRQLKRVVIELDPNSYTALPRAQITLNDYSTQQIQLPRDLGPVNKMLTDADIDFTYAPIQASGTAWQALKGILEELLVPTLLLAATGALGIGMVNWWQKRQRGQEIEEALSKAHKTFSDVHYAFKETLSELDRSVKQALMSFYRDEADVLVIKGLPGAGKTHALLAMCKEILQRKQNTFFLEIGPGAGDDVRQLVREIYSGDKKLTAKALDKLTRENKGEPVKELILYADEIEKISGDVLEFVINNGIGNPTAKVENLPVLRLVGTCNYWPAFLSNHASASRSEAVLFNPFPPEKVGKVFTKELLRKFPEQIDAKAIENVIGSLFEEYPGYSNRSVTRGIISKVVNQLQQSGDYRPEAIVGLLRDVLETRPLNNTEIAALMIQMLLDKIQNGRQPLAEGGEENVWMLLTTPAEEATQEMNFHLKANGRQYKRMIAALLNDHPLDYINDPQVLEKTIQAIGKSLRLRHVQALRYEHPQLAAEQELVQELTAYIQAMLDNANADVKENEKEPNPQHDATYQALEHAQKVIRNASRDSDVGKTLSEAARIYQALKALNPEENAVLDRQKLDAVFQAALQYHPAEYNESNTFNVYPDPLYEHLFYQIRKLLLMAGQSGHWIDR